MFEELGEKAFNFALFTAILFTVFGLIAIANGVNIPDTYSSLFIPLKNIYSYTEQLKSGLETINETQSGNVFERLFGWIRAGVAVTAMSLSVAGVLLNIMFLVLTIFLHLVAIIQNVLPPTLSFLVLPFAFIASFLQLSVWIYLVKKILSLLPFIRISG